MLIPIINDAKNPSKLWAVSTRDAHACTIHESTNSPSAENHGNRRIIVKFRKWKSRNTKVNLFCIIVSI